MTNNLRFQDEMITSYLTLPQYDRSLPRRMCRTHSTLQEEPGKPATADSESNNEDDASDLLDVRIRCPFKASSYNPIQIPLPSSTPAPLFNYVEVGRRRIRFLFPY